MSSSGSETVASPLDFRLYLITDRHQVRKESSLLDVVTSALKGGVKAVQLREKDLSVDTLRPMAMQLRELTALYGAKLLLNQHVDLALDVAADGVHLGRTSLPVHVARNRMGPDKLIGVSTHHVREIHHAFQQGADFVTFGPVFETPSKAHYGSPQGLEQLSEACRQSPGPVFALGGITVDRVKAVRESGAFGIALISAIIASPDPEKSTRTFLT